MKPVDRRSSAEKQETSFFLKRAVVSAALSLISFTERTGLSYLLQLMISFLLTVIAAPILGIFFIAIPLHKLLIQKLVDFIYSEEHLEIVNNSSLRTALSTRKNPGVITCALLVNQIPNISEVQQIIRRKIYQDGCAISNGSFRKNLSNLTKILTTRLCCYAWKPCPDFKIENMVYVNNANDEITTDTLHKYISDLSFNKLPKNCPPWRIIIVPMKTQFSSTRSCAFVFQYHQLLSKQFSLILDAFVCGSKKIKLFPVSYRFPTLKRTGHVNFDSIMKQTLDFLNIISILGGIPLMLFKEFISWSSEKHHRSVRNKNFEALAWSESIPIVLVDEIKEKIGVGVKQSDILLSCIGGALRQYFTMMEGNIPDDILSILPVYPLSPLSLGEENPLGCLSVNLPLHEVDPVQRLKQLKRRLQKSKDHSLFYDSSRLLVRYLPRILPFSLTKLVANFFTAKYPIVISNDYLNINSTVFWNCEVEAFYYWRPAIANIGLSLSLIRHKNDVTLTAISRSSFLQRPDLLLSCFVREVKDLALNLGVKNIRGISGS